MKGIHSIFIFLILFSATSIFAEDKKKIYDPAADAQKDVAAFLQKAGQEQKHLLIQVGGNWCSWCHKLHGFFSKNDSIAAFLNKNFTVYHLNHSKENWNLDILKSYNFPQRFGFPVLLILDKNGNVIHTQDSALLESSKTYDPTKVMRFLKLWAPTAFDEKHYLKE